MLDVLLREYGPSRRINFDEIAGDRKWPGTMLQAIADSTLEDLSALGLIWSHGVFYGLHHYLPRASRYVALFREPLRRLVSDFAYQYFWEKKPLPSPGDELNDALFKFQMEHGRHQYLYRLLGYEAVNYDIDSDEAIERAKEILSVSVLPLLTEMYDESMFILAKVFRWASPRIWMRHHSSAQKLRPEQLHDDVIRELKIRLKSDIAIYKAAQEKFNATLSALTPSDRARLTLYKAECEAAQALIAEFARPITTSLIERLITKEKQRVLIIGEGKMREDAELLTQKLGHTVVASMDVSTKDLAQYRVPEGLSPNLIVVASPKMGWIAGQLRKVVDIPVIISCAYVYG